MNFFEHQEKARQKTNRLVLLFVLAVFLIASAIYLVVRAAFFYLSVNASDPNGALSFRWWDPDLFLRVVASTIGFVALMSFYRILTLRQGGAAVARMMGAMQVTPETKDQGERRLLNVVEEMAIASGVPVPQVFVMDQEIGINAFAAGFSQSDAAVAVTRGALEQLSRDELQGVVAHEFSHILNGDMRLNLRMIGVLFGILAIAIVGRFVLKGSRGRGRGAAAAFIIGLSLLLIGYIGLFIGRLIQSAVSRQREFLADSSAVQFTRNPGGIAGALRKIAGHSSGSYLASPETAEVGHLLFGVGTRLALFSDLMATHPPIQERIRRIDPRFLAGDATAAPSPAPAGPAAAAVAGFGGGKVRSDPDAIVSRVGRLDEQSLARSAAILAGVPADVRSNLSTPDGAQRVVFALLFSADPEERVGQRAILERNCGAEEAEACETLHLEVRRIDPAYRLPLADLATPVLRLLAPEQTQRFLVIVEALVAADGKVTLFEFALRWLLTRRLARRVGRKVAFESVDRVAWEIGNLLAGIALAGHPGDAEGACRAFRSGLKTVSVQREAKLVEGFEAREIGSLEQVGQALDRLAFASYRIKEKVIRAAAYTAMEDRVLTLPETELLRLVSISLDCPLPPFVETPGRV